MDELIVERFDSAQRRAISMLGSLTRQAEPGMGARDLTAMAGDLLGSHDFERWLRPPAVRIALPGAQWPAWRPGSQPTRLGPGSALTLRLQPAAGLVSAHVGATVIVGAPETAIVAAARDCTRALCGYASGLKCVGELFIYARTWALTHGQELADRRSIGHALPVEPAPGEGLAARLRSAAWLRRNQVHILNPRRLSGLWVIAPTLAMGGASASFHEVVLIQPGLRRVLGRDDLDQVGSLL